MAAGNVQTSVGKENFGSRADGQEFVVMELVHGKFRQFQYAES